MQPCLPGRQGEGVFQSNDGDVWDPTRDRALWVLGGRTGQGRAGQGSCGGHKEYADEAGHCSVGINVVRLQLL